MFARIMEVKEELLKALTPLTIELKDGPAADELTGVLGELCSKNPFDIFVPCVSPLLAAIEKAYNRLGPGVLCKATYSQGRTPRQQWL